jgi:hypothetical protein
MRPTRRIDDEDGDISIWSRKNSFRIAGKECSIQSEGESDARGRGATELFNETVVAPTTTDRRMCGGECSADEFEGRSSVIVQSTYETIVDDEGHAETGESPLHFLKVFGCRRT